MASIEARLERLERARPRRLEPVAGVWIDREILGWAVSAGPHQIRRFWGEGGWNPAGLTELEAAAEATAPGWKERPSWRA